MTLQVKESWFSKLQVNFYVSVAKLKNVIIVKFGNER